MKLSKKHQRPDSEVAYKLDTQDGQFCEARMRASVAEEIVRTAESVELCDDEEYGLLVNGRMMFPTKAFTFDEGELEKIPKHGSRPAKKAGRPTHKELVDKADKTLTNPQLHEAIKNAEAEKAQKAEEKQGAKAEQAGE